MSLSIQDFTKGVDFTGVNPATGADHNNLIELAAPVYDTVAEGKGIVLWSVDSALNTPIVPNAATITKWQRYLWIRILHSTSTSHVPLVYAWDNNAVSHATYLKWQRVEADLTAVNASIVAIQADVANALSIANAATVTANNAALNATTALTNANTALATANTANANALQALADAAAATAAAATAQARADSAYTRAEAAQTSANVALNATNFVSRYVKVSDTRARNTAPQIAVAVTWNKKEINTEDADSGGLATIAGNDIILQVGVYRIRAVSLGPEHSAQKLALIDMVADTVVLLGVNHFQGNNSWVGLELNGVLVATSTNNRFALYHYSTDAGAMGYVNNVAYDGVDQNEVYTTIEFEKLS